MLGAAVAIVMYIPLLIGILTDKVKQPFSMWLLWMILDGSVLASVVVQKGNYILLAVYTTASLIITSALLYKKQFGWGKFESLIAALAAICMVIWGLSGPKVATIMLTSAVVISTFPQFRDAWKEPAANPWKTWFGFAIANALSTAGGKEWSIEERFYTASCTILCLALAGINAIKK